MTSKKILFFLTLTLLANVPVVFAGGALTPPVKNYDGFFGGVGIGVALTSFSGKGNAAVTYFNPLLNSVSYSTHFSADSSNEDFISQLHLGYGRQLGSSDFYLGGVVGANLSTHAPNGVVRNFELSFGDALIAKNDAHLRAVEVTLDLHPGYLFSFSQSLLYAVIGVAFNHLSYRVSTDFSNDSTPVSYSVSSEVSRNIEGLRVGLGLQEKLSQSVALFLQYVYTRYGSLATNREASFLSTVDPSEVDTVTASGTVRPTRHSILLGADWYFSQ